jgi:hypothetical protein
MKEKGYIEVNINLCWDTNNSEITNEVISNIFPPKNIKIKTDNKKPFSSELLNIPAIASVDSLFTNITWNTKFWKPDLYPYIEHTVISEFGEEIKNKSPGADRLEIQLKNKLTLKDFNELFFQDRIISSVYFFLEFNKLFRGKLPENNFETLNITEFIDKSCQPRKRSFEKVSDLKFNITYEGGKEVLVVRLLNNTITIKVDLKRLIQESKNEKIIDSFLIPHEILKLCTEEKSRSSFFNILDRIRLNRIIKRLSGV